MLGRRILVWTLLILCGCGSVACDRRSGSTGTPGPLVPTEHPRWRLLDVPYKSQDNYFFCGPATVQMWRAYKGKEIDTQDPYGIGTQMNIWIWMYDRWPYPYVWPYVGVRGEPVADAVNWYAFDNNVFETNQPIVNNYPDLAPDQAISMQAAAADPHGEPTIVMINDYTHWVITRGGYWDVLATSQPSANIIQYHDPLDGPDKTPTVAQWKDYIGNPVHNVGIYYQQHAVNGLQVFYNYGGTYYGDPDPPVCDPPESCEPLEAGLLPRTVGGIKTLFANLFSQPGTSSASRGTAYTRPTVKGSSNWVSVLSQVMAGPTHRFKRLHQGPGRQKFGPRKYIYVPHPYTHKESEIIDNCLTGLRQSKMDQLTAYAPLTHDPSVTVSSIREVKSKTATPDYYLLTFSDGAGRPFASAAVSEVGWLLEAGLLPEGRISPTEEAVSSIVEKHGKWGAHGLRWLMIASSQAGCTNTLSPMAVMDSDDGSTVVVNSRGQAYQQDPNGEITVKTHDGGSFGLRRLK